MYCYSIESITKFVELNSRLVEKEKDKFSAMMDIIYSIPLFVEELENSCDDEIEDTKEIIKLILTDYSSVLDNFHNKDLTLAENYSFLLFGSNIFAKENFYQFVSSTYKLALNLQDENGNCYKSLEESFNVLLNVFVKDCASIKYGVLSLGDFLYKWKPNSI